MTCAEQEYLAAYVLRALEGEEYVEVARHLEGCASCSREVDTFDRTAGLLALLDLDDVDRVLDAEEPHDHAQPRRRRLVLAAAAVSVAGIGAGVIAGHGSGGSDGHELVLRATDATTRVSAVLTVDPQHRRTGLHLALRGAYPSGTCRLVVRADDGRTETVASWAADGSGSAQVDATTSIAPADLDVVDVLTASGQQLVQMDAPQPNN